jgi:drug/metabolite transporter (DMT)-like permease
MTSSIDQAEPPPRETAATPWALLSLLLGVLLLAFAAIFTRLAEAELSASATVFNRYLLASIALGFWQLLSKRLAPQPPEPIEFDNNDRGLVLLSSVLGTGAVLLWAISLTQTSVANSNLLHNVTPVFAVLGGWLFLGQRFDARYLIGILLAMAGVAIMSLADLRDADGSLVGDGIALLSAVFYACNYLTREKLRVKFSALQILFWTCLLSTLYTGLMVWRSHSQPFPQSWQTWAAVIGLAVACQVLGQGLLIHQLKRYSASFVTLLMLLEPLITASLAAVIFSERLSPLNWLAFVIVLAGIGLARLSTGAASASAPGHEDLVAAP